VNKPKIVHWDLETLPDAREIYKVIPSIGAWPGRTFKAELQTIMCFGYKIEGQAKAKSLNVWDYADDIHNDAALVHMAYEILHDADEIVTHNGKRFDVKVMNTRLSKHGMPPLPKIHHVDTQVICKSHLSLYSNSLANVAKFYKLDDKMTFSNKWGMWERFAFGEDTPKDRHDMSEYCKMDVEVLQQIYHKTRPFHGNSTVNKNIVNPDEMVCPTCGEDALVSNGWRISGGTAFQRMQCTACGSWSKLNKKQDKVSGF